MKQEGLAGILAGEAKYGRAVGLVTAKGRRGKGRRILGISPRAEESWANGGGACAPGVR
jgi:hypothetical protein